MITKMTSHDLISGAPVIAMIGKPEADPLIEKAALQEAPLNEMAFAAINMPGRLLVDHRGALAFRIPSTALLLLAGVESLRWDHRMAAHHEDSLERR